MAAATVLHATTPWDQHFWSEDNSSYDVLEKMSEQACDVMAMYGDWLAERAEAEEQYSKRLRRLVEAPAGGIGALRFRGAGQDEGICGIIGAEFCKTLRVAFEELRGECQQRAGAHKEFASTLLQLGAELRDAAKEQRRVRKQILAEAAACLKEKSKCEGAIKKARVAYAECVAKAEASQGAVDAASAQTRPRSELEKAQQRAQKHAKDEMLLDQEYKEAILAWQIYHPDFVECYDTFILTMQQQEEQRVDLLRKQLVATAQQLDRTAPVVEAAQARLAAAAEQISRDKDLSEWVAEHRTGDSLMPPPQYVPKSARSKLSEAVVVTAMQLLPASAVSADSSPLLQASVSPKPLGSGSSSAAAAELCAAGASRVTVRALHDFVGEEADELDFFVGDLVEVIVTQTQQQQATGWWVGCCHGRTGWFPASFVEDNALCQQLPHLQLQLETACTSPAVAVPFLVSTGSAASSAP